MDPMGGGSQLSCAACGTGLRASARFCDGCGAPIDSPRPAEERKQVTVLFADVVGSMKMAAALDAERLREIMHDLFNRSVSVVQRYHGTVDSFTGDGLMAPLVHLPPSKTTHCERASPGSSCKHWRANSQSMSGEGTAWICASESG